MAQALPAAHLRCILPSQTLKWRPDFSDKQSVTVSILMNPYTLLAPRLLIATANHSLRERITNLLADQGYLIQRAEDSSGAAHILLNSNPPDIALLDSALPGQNSIQLAADIKRRSPDRQTWIILLATAQMDAPTVAMAADAGIDDLLLCPDGGPVSAVDLGVRLSVAARVLEHIQRLEAKARAISLNSLHDAVTGLWNRESILSLLFAETDRVQRMSTPLSLLLLDLDNFSQINTEHGFEVGDKILHEMAVRLRRYMRSYDLLGRSGDDEFLLALPGCNAHQARHLAGRIRTVMLHNPFAAGSGKIKVTASIGLAQSRGRTPLVVLREAEQSLAAAKRDGRNCEREFLSARQEEALVEDRPVV